MLSPRPPEAGKMPVVFILVWRDAEVDAGWVEVGKGAMGGGVDFVMVCERNRSRCSGVMSASGWRLVT